MSCIDFDETSGTGLVSNECNQSLKESPLSESVKTAVLRLTEPTVGTYFTIGFADHMSLECC